MSLLGDFLGGTAEALAENIDKTSENKRVLAEQMRREEVQRSESDRLRRLDRKDEDRKLGREVKEQYPDLATKEMVTIYQNGREERRPLRANELKAMEREDAKADQSSRHMEALINAMNRPSAGGTAAASTRTEKPLTREEARLLAEAEAARKGLRPGTAEHDNAVLTRTAAIFASGATRSDFRAAPSGNMALPLAPVQRLAPGAPGGPEDQAAALIRQGLPFPALWSPSP